MSNWTVLYFCVEKGELIHHLETDSFIIKGTGPAVVLVIMCDVYEVFDVILF